ncbi:hypothetical protein EPA93_09195 [Ktedonosporobacter rubrisoli]|uniref:Uncharacterized protein n=1 Tax=Ktedonosporobacter rubrisoli TaxID=2509675 RepID=A0A4P6JLT6_KTERU|nr:hypothetical protein [Ktedonosporobacter rubrisoli]QBD76174.1 hypothetical protein EPA93_09195 [Ktedonosporobacter rubrisoli]
MAEELFDVTGYAGAGNIYASPTAQAAPASSWSAPAPAPERQGRMRGHHAARSHGHSSHVAHHGSHSRTPRSRLYVGEKAF